MKGSFFIVMVIMNLSLKIIHPTTILIAVGAIQKSVYALKQEGQPRIIYQDFTFQMVNHLQTFSKQGWNKEPTATAIDALTTELLDWITIMFEISNGAIIMDYIHRCCPGQMCACRIYPWLLQGAWAVFHKFSVPHPCKVGPDLAVADITFDPLQELSPL